MPQAHWLKDVYTTVCGRPSSVTRAFFDGYAFNAEEERCESCREVFQRGLILGLYSNGVQYVDFPQLAPPKLHIAILYFIPKEAGTSTFDTPPEVSIICDSQGTVIGAIRTEICKADSLEEALNKATPTAHEVVLNSVYLPHNKEE